MAVEPKHITIERRVRYAVLEPHERLASEIWFVLHGYNQLAHRFLRYFQPIHTSARCIVAAEGLHRQYIDHESRRVGASWMTSEDRLTDIEDYVGYLDRLHAHILAEESRPRTGGSKPVRIVGLGFSQGVHTLCRWLAFGRARIDRAVLWGSTVPPDLDLAEHGATLSAADLHLVVGEQDEYYDAAAVDAHEARLRQAGVDFTPHTFSGGHRLDAGVLRGLTLPGETNGT
ncbi:alpha/beta hydrolase [Candidatus Palauibacter sp.]|uniref:alpha/beta hydrolase n=1 Tax=Candidatus Palauibacter sp. TaxID=3101350 RepID=UPI003C6F8C4F